MNILTIVDKEDSAIARMARYIQTANPHHTFRILPFHPKRPSLQQMNDVEEALVWCDIVDFQYWKSAEMLRSLMAVTKPTILTHHNPYDIAKDTWRWNEYGMNVVLNNTQRKLINMHQCKQAFHPVDVYFWKYQEEFAEERLKTVIMVSSRIEGKKGVLEVAEVTEQLGLNLILVGRPSDTNYLAKVLEHKNVTYYENVSDVTLRELYYRSGIHICNSIDNFESGTLPILEAMACGVPVLTRKIGHVPDIYSGKNMVVRAGQPNDTEDLKKELQNMVNNYEWLCQMREDAWYSIKNRNIERFGRMYSKFYYELLLGGDPLVSVIIPTFNRKEQLNMTIAAIATNVIYLKHLEIVIADDGSTDGTSVFAMLKEIPRVTVKYVKTDLYQRFSAGKGEFLYSKIYGIAHARNIAIMEAEGDYLLLCDDRISPDPKAISEFLKEAKPKTWLFGEKGGVKKEFVENFSFINRQTLIDIGMFPEVITQYGGMTQATSKRAKKCGIDFKFVSTAKASVHAKSKNRMQRWSDIAKSKTQCYKLGYE